MIIIDRKIYTNTNEDKEIQKKKKSCGNLRKSIWGRVSEIKKQGELVENTSIKDKLAW